MVFYTLAMLKRLTLISATLPLTMAGAIYVMMIPIPKKKKRNFSLASEIWSSGSVTRTFVSFSNLDSVIVV